MLGKRFELFMVQQVHIALADAFKVIPALNFHWFCFDERSVFVIAAFRRDFADINLRVKIRGKRITVVAPVAVEDVDFMDLIKFVFQGVG